MLRSDVLRAGRLRAGRLRGRLLRAGILCETLRLQAPRQALLQAAVLRSDDLLRPGGLLRTSGHNHTGRQRRAGTSTGTDNLRVKAFWSSGLESVGCVGRCRAWRERRSAPIASPTAECLGYFHPSRWRPNRPTTDRSENGLPLDNKDNRPEVDRAPAGCFSWLRPTRPVNPSSARCRRGVPSADRCRRSDQVP